MIFRKCGIVVGVWIFALLCLVGSAKMPGPQQGSWNPPDPGSGPASSSSNPWAPMVKAQQGSAKARAEGTPPRAISITSYSAPRRSARQLIQLHEAAAAASAPKPVSKPRPGSQSVIPAPGAADSQEVVAPSTTEVTERINLGEAPWKQAPPPLPGDMPVAPLMTPRSNVQHQLILKSRQQNACQWNQ